MLKSELRHLVLKRLGTADHRHDAAGTLGRSWPTKALRLLRDGGELLPEVRAELHDRVLDALERCGWDRLGRRGVSREEDLGWIARVETR